MSMDTWQATGYMLRTHNPILIVPKVDQVYDGSRLQQVSDSKTVLKGFLFNKETTWYSAKHSVRMCQFQI